MDLSFTAEESAFRDQVRRFIGAHLPEPIRRHMAEGRPATRDMIAEWTRILHDHGPGGGWSVPRWPAEHGGPGWSVVQQYIFIEENQAFPAPDLLSFGASMVGPVIYTFGSAAQKARYLPRIADLSDWWCQGFSEPGAGSDLAALRTRAVRDGEGWLLNGQKTWTTQGQHANRMFVLARTDPTVAKQKGISFFLMDMDLPGVSVRPIQTIDGGHEVNEVFLDNVRLPGDALVGQENRGWDYAKFLLGNERTGIARIGVSKGRLRRITDLAGRRIVAGRPLLEHPRFRDALTELRIELKALEITAMRLLAAAAQQGASGRPDPLSSVLKLKGAALQQRTTELLLEVLGEHALPGSEGAALAGLDWADAIPALYFNMRKVSIYGGSSEVQKNIIAKAVLGL